eukprot:TRINITY_DN16209_c0_g1_i1.p1 TRINITY_DN16209_c0_g1~~TRINITY_DN16209_c0_g1_i1.p1  ORF type:complete len:330 (-),score=39.12 TRINITY_DN16209_c0_g1_i1:101-1090(-)
MECCKSNDHSLSLDPTPLEDKTWRFHHIAFLWVGLVVNIASYMIAAGLLDLGLYWWEAMIVVIIGNFILVAPMILNAQAGTKYGICFPIFVRSIFGTRGAKFIALARGVVGIGWFGIQTWIGGDSIYRTIVIFHGEIHLAKFMGINILQFFTFLLFWGVNVIFVFRGAEAVKKMEILSAPILILSAMILIIWSTVKVGSVKKILSVELSKTTHKSFWSTFGAPLTIIVSSWSTMSLNFADFSRYCASNKDQVIGQLLGLPPTSIVFAFLGLYVTNAAYLIYGKILWNPLDLIDQINNRAVSFFSMIVLLLATLSTNVAAHIIGPAYDIS